MDRYSIVMMHTSGEKAGRLLDKVSGRIEPLARDAALDCTRFAGHQEIVCAKKGPGRWTATDRKLLSREISAGVARFIVEEEEEDLLRSMFARYYSYSDAEDVAKLLGFCRQVQEGEEGSQLHAKRLKRLAKEVEDALKENGMVNLQGLLAFRLRHYREELKDTVDYAVDEYLMDKQYQEFISLLKYFVCIQQAKIPTVHLLHKGGSEFSLLNERQEPIDPSVSGGGITVETLEKELNFEDLIVSTLITVAPGKIYIHSRQPDLPVIKTILQIFEERASLCDCNRCGIYPAERKKDRI